MTNKLKRFKVTFRCSENKDNGLDYPLAENAKAAAMLMSQRYGIDILILNIVEAA